MRRESIDREPEPDVEDGDDVDESENPDVATDDHLVDA